MLIFLIGMPASGKTTITRALGQQMNLPVYDTDDIIEKQEDKTIAHIFESCGEEYFRILENQLIREWPHEKGIVSTGGGMPCFQDNMAMLKKKGTTVYLETDAEVLTRRLMFSTHRPLLKDTSFSDIQRFVRQTLAERNFYYKQADIMIPQQDTINETVEKIAEIVSTWQRDKRIK